MVATLLRLISIDVKRLARETAITIVLAMLGAFAAMKPKCRYNIRLAQRKGVTVRTAARADLAAFDALMAATSARDDIAADLRRLSADVISLKDTVAELAKAVTTEVGGAATGIGEDIASAAKDKANTLLSEFEAAARRNPLGVVIGAFGIGMFIGLMKGRR